jgi:hypothetical protein
LYLKYYAQNVPSWALISINQQLIPYCRLYPNARNIFFSSKNWLIPTI